MPRVLGLDFGTLSCRVLCLDLDRPGELLEGVAPFRHGVLSSSLPGGRELPGGDWALQDSGDYLEAAELALERCLPRGDARREQVIGIGVDCTASSPLPARASGEPLSCELPGEPHAYVKLWKHHRAEPWVARVREAPEAETWLKNYGGQLSCEWLLPKALELAGEAPEIWQRTERFVEAGDWIVQQLTGNWTRNLCAAGFKGMWAGEWPEPAALARLDPKLEGFVSEKLQGELLPPGVKAGELTVEMAERLGLPSGIAVSAATIDAHSGLLGMGIRGPGTLGMIMGTSACQLWLSPEERHIPGVMGVVRDGILPGCYAYEAGQAAVGDLFSFYLSCLCPEQASSEAELHRRLGEAAAELPPGSHGHVLLDWVNGNRSVLLEPGLSGALFGLTLDSRPAEIYRACLEATAFGCRVILERVAEAGVRFEQAVACGGLCRNELLMQIHADVLGLPVRIAAATETVALGAALYGAMAAGRPIEGLTEAPEKEYRPNPDAAAAYDGVYELYKRLHDHFGTRDPLLKNLRASREP